MFKTFVATCLLLAGLGSPAFATPDHIIHFDLALGGYQIGMPYDEANLVRPFAMTEIRVRPDGQEITVGSVDQVYIDDIELRFYVDFVAGRISKVIGHFAPADIEKLRTMLFESLGESEPDTRVVVSGDGKEFLLYHDRWQFPDTTLDLIGTELNTSFATLALTSVGRQERIRRNEQLQAVTPDGAAATNR